LALRIGHFETLHFEMLRVVHRVAHAGPGLNLAGRAVLSAFESDASANSAATG
jgi:hypothetical protein